MATWQPVTPVVDTLREVFFGGEVAQAATLGFVWCLGLVVVAAGLITWAFPRRAAR